MENDVKDYKDRKVGLVAFGIVQLMIGGLCALAVPMMLVGVMAAAMTGAETGLSVRTMIPGVLVYVFAATAFIWLGVGSILARRWARALLLVFSWIMLIGGTVGLLIAVPFMRGMFASSLQQEGLPSEFQTIVLAVTIAFMALIYVVIPGAHILFYRSPHVKATCEARDPKERWTDRCPLPVLALCLLVFMWGTGPLYMVGYNFAVPFFGQILGGMAGAGWILIVGGVSIWLLIGLYRLKPPAWWGTLVTMLIYMLSCAITFLKVDIMEYYEMMGLPDEQLDIIRNADIFNGNSMAIMVGLYAIPFLALMIYLRKYFISKY